MYLVVGLVAVLFFVLTGLSARVLSNYISRSEITDIPPTLLDIWEDEE